MCLFVVETRPAKRSAGGTCEVGKVGLFDHFRIPKNVNNKTCYDRDECFSAFATFMVFNLNSRQMEALNIVVDCITRVSCQHGQKDIAKTSKFDANGKLYTMTSCKKPEDEIFIMLPRMKSGGLIYEKVVYDCRCRCS